MSALDRISALEKQVAELEQQASRQDEKIDGAGGLVKAMGVLTEEVRAMKRAMLTVGGGIIVSAVGFGFAVLQLTGKA